MEKTIEIPEGYEARIEGGKVIIERKSEDNRIRREMIEYFHGCIHRNKKTGFRVEQIKVWIAYLERQKEQQSAEDKDAIEVTPKQDYSGLTDFERAIHRGFLCAGVENVPVSIIKDTAQDCLAQIKPVEWSEEDERLISTSISFLKNFADKGYENAVECIDWLKSLRPNYWKPSEEQMEALDWAAGFIEESSKAFSDALKSLYTDLKKL